jgi:hypothetical protein
MPDEHDHRRLVSPDISEPHLAAFGVLHDDVTELHGTSKQESLGVLGVLGG